jgi:hypothetical protein
VFFAETGDTLEVPVDQYLEDISDDELSANASAYETTEAKNAGRLRNQKRVDQRRWLQEALPIHNLNAALDFVTAGNHTTPPEQRLMSINMIGRRLGTPCARPHN